MRRVQPTPEVEALLGKYGDTDLARLASKMMGRSIGNTMAMQWREERGIEVVKDLDYWERRTDLRYPGMRELFGTMSDKAIGARFEIATTSVAIQRHRLQMDKAPPTHKRVYAWRAKYPGLEEMLGTIPDQEIADKYGLSRARVHQYRMQLGISPVSKDHSEQIAPFRDKLGSMSDSKVAKLAGVPYRSVGDYRRDAGIEAFPTKTPIPDGLIPLLGTTSDRKLATMFNLTPNQVLRERTKREIPTYRKYSRWNPLDKDEILRLLNEGRSDAEISRLLGSSTTSVRRIRLDLGLPSIREHNKCSRGHDMTGNNVKIRPDGRRQRRACTNIRGRKTYERKRLRDQEK